MSLTLKWLDVHRGSGCEVEQLWFLYIVTLQYLDSHVERRSELQKGLNETGNKVLWSTSHTSYLPNPS